MRRDGQELREPSAAAARRRARRRIVSPLTRRILTVNLLALGVPVAGLLYLGQYEDGLVEAELASLTTQGEIFAGALGQSAVRAGDGGAQSLRGQVARPMLRRLVRPTRARARLFTAGGGLLADSRDLLGPRGAMRVEELPPPGSDGLLRRLSLGGYEAVVAWLPARRALPRYREAPDRRAGGHPEAVRALSGEPARSMRLAPDGGKILIAAVPVQRFKKVVGALMLTRGADDVEHALREVRLAILWVFAMALGVTVLLSFYLAGTVARPVRRLAAAAERVRGGMRNEAAIPDFTRRRDEIGDLSGALRDMTAALWRRMVAVESFAADVAHEIKNPLTSLQSAVETASRIGDPEQRRKLMAVIEDDVRRLDRLITDISDASRLDAELARADVERIDLRLLLETLVVVHRATAAPGRSGVAPVLDAVGDAPFAVDGVEGRLVQVFQNLIGNAVSFSPPGGGVRLAIRRAGGAVEIDVDDDGPGLPGDKLDAVFERFYSERPETEKFGTHSGLGLSISRQIVEAHGGAIVAANRYADDGGVAGARFTVRLPAA